MQAKKCDRCGELYEFYEDAKFNNIVLVIDRKFTTSIRVREYDLCRSCMSSLKDWLDMTGEKEGQHDKF